MSADVSLFDWKTLLPVFGLAAIGWLWLALLPALVRAVHALFRREPERALATVMVILDSREGRVRMKAYTDELYASELAERRATIAEALDTARENSDKLEQIDFTTRAHGAALKEVTVAIGEVPNLANAVERFSAAMERVVDKMETMSEQLTRVDEREKERERRMQQTFPHPHNRKEDLP